MNGLRAADENFVSRAIRRRRLFLALALVGVAIAAALAVYYGDRRFGDPEYSVGPRLVVVLLILLNARQNLRQYRYATVLKRIHTTPR